MTMLIGSDTVVDRRVRPRTAVRSEATQAVLAEVAEYATCGAIAVAVIVASLWLMLSMVSMPLVFVGVIAALVGVACHQESAIAQRTNG